MAAGRKTGGRVKGTPNKANADLRALAQQWTDVCVWKLGRAVLGKDMSAAVAAAKVLLAYGHGQPKASVDLNIVKPVYATSDRPLSDEEWEREFAAAEDRVASPGGAPSRPRKVRPT